MTLGWDNTSSSFHLFRIHVIRLLVGTSACVCSGRSVLLRVYMFHMRCFACSLLHWYILNITFFCLICCAAPFPPPLPLLLQRPYNIPLPLLEQIYIYISFVLCLSLWICCEFILLPSFASLLSLPSGTVTCATFCATKKNRERNAMIQRTVAVHVMHVITVTVSMKPIQLDG